MNMTIDLYSIPRSILVTIDQTDLAKFCLKQSTVFAQGVSSFPCSKLVRAATEALQAEDEGSSVGRTQRCDSVYGGFTSSIFAVCPRSK